MAKRVDFEKLLDQEFRWPVNGDELFVVADETDENANIEPDSFARLVFMIEGYKKAADLLASQAIEEARNRDFLIYPIIFNYRQFLELSLKYQLETFGGIVGVKPIWNSHDLDVLWKSFIQMLEKYGTVDPDEADHVVGIMVNEFSKIDRNSFSHRYPVDTKGRPIPVMQSQLHLPILVDCMDGISNYFAGCDGYFSHKKTEISK